MMIYLLDETIADIEQSGFTPEDIIFIGDPQSSHSCSWEEFKVLAFDVPGDSECANEDLRIVFKDGTMLLRWGYDGDGGWWLLEPFAMPKVKKKIKRLCGGSFEDEYYEESQ
jgi:hypothetical protein